MKAGRAFAAGMAGGVVMSILMFLGRTMMGMQANLEMMLGTMMVDPGQTAWIIGFVIHLMLSGAIALIYAWGFEHVTHRAGAAIGTGFGAIHAIIAGVVMGMMPMIHPRMPNPIPAPGAFLSNMGTTGVVAEIVLHLIYGAVVGAMYGAVINAGTAQTTTSRPIVS